VKRLTLSAAVLIACLASAPAALAHEPVGSAAQACVENQIELTASFDNPGFEGATTVTATDSQAGSLGTPQPTPASFSATYPGPERLAGIVTFAWSADDGDSGSLEASYEAVSGCEAPPPPPPPPPDDTPPPPEKPDQSPPPGRVHLVPPVSAESPPEHTNNSVQPQRETLPFTGSEKTPWLAALGALLLGAGTLLRRIRGES
jgi:LPXTG-motif cell wall-anchored protein